VNSLFKDFPQAKIQSKEELIKYVEQCNNEIEFDNYLKPVDQRDPLLDMDYILKRYGQISYRERAQNFREKHDCKYCLYYEKPRQCFETKKCPLDLDGSYAKTKVAFVPTCSRDLEGKCPYGNEVGTCFGCCYRDVLKGYRENKKKECEANDY
jgi:hypothetical protein